MTDEPVTTDYTQADYERAAALLDEVMFGQHSHDGANAVVARALAAARVVGYDQGWRDALA
jgi:hypothetical protein